ncbi:hypothetical protein ABKN59_003652 [Abortiporus biennis]
MSSQQVLNYSENVYLTVTVSPELAQQPSGLLIHPSLTTLGQVGELRDVQFVSVPKAKWDNIHNEVISSLQELAGVSRVEVLDPPKQRVKRGGDEL